MSSAKKFLKEKHEKQQKRTENYLKNSKANFKQIESFLEKHRTSDKEDLLKTFTQFLDSATKGEPLKLELPAMDMGLLSNLLYNCALYVGNMQQVQKADPLKSTPVIDEASDVN